MISQTKQSKAFSTPDYTKLVNEKQIDQIQQISAFASSSYAGLNIADTLDFFTRRYVRQVFQFTDIDHNSIIADIGAGFGWLSMAFAFSTDAKLIAFDVDTNRIMAGKAIAEILGLQGRIDWRSDIMNKLPLKDKEVDIAYCIEVLEHTKKETMLVQELCRISKTFIILTTPNLWFPVIAHDTGLPFCHWLPVRYRKKYAHLLNRHQMEYDNLFWSPTTLLKQMKGFKPVSRWLHYKSLQHFKDTYPFYSPYGKGKYVKKPGFTKTLFYEIVSRLGMWSHYIVPSLSFVFQRTESLPSHYKKQTV